MSARPKRGEVWICALEPTVGHEIQKSRPCLVVSPDDLNSRVGTVCVMPLTSGAQPTRFRVEVQFDDKAGRLLADQLRFIDRTRCRKRLGVIDRQALSAALQVLRDMFEE